MIVISFDDIVIMSIVLILGMLWITEIISDKVHKRK